MDIHKPKPWHGLREFLKEYLIIVIGVLTALSAEAGVEWLHWRHLAAQHEQDLRASAVQIVDLSVERLAQAPCARAELKRMAAALRASGDWKGANPGPDTPPGEYLLPALLTQGRPWPSAAWEAAVSDGALVHLPRKQVALYAFLFEVARDIQLPQEQEKRVRAQLTPLAIDQSLSAEQRAHYLAIVGDLDGLEATADAMARSAIVQAGQKSIQPDPTDMKSRMAQLLQRMPQGCVREVDVDATQRTRSIQYKSAAAGN
ncbi:hypothetical protein [Phenylobacterium sp.]|uniref:hypothetical protein n=1 Tax=Phenylobacterium sp. TaxID=1871053 RepID=UPI002F4052F2